MKFDFDDKNRCRLVCVKFHLNRCRFAVAVAKCFWDTVCDRFTVIIADGDNHGKAIAHICPSLSPSVCFHSNF